MRLEASFPISATYLDENSKERTLDTTEELSHYSEIKALFENAPNLQSFQNWKEFISEYQGAPSGMEKIQSMETSIEAGENGIYGIMIFQSAYALTEQERNDLTAYIDLQLIQGKGKLVKGTPIQTEGGEIRIQVWSLYAPLFIVDDLLLSKNVMPKYRITDIQHPIYPECYRIQALRDVDVDVHAGDLGGYIEKVWNLDHGGTCWIGEHAVCHGLAAVRGESRVTGYCELKGEALLTGTSLIQGRCLVEGNSYIKDAFLYGAVKVTGDAIIESHPDSKEFPTISGKSIIQGSVIGRVVIDDSTVAYGEKLINHGHDQMLLENGIQRFESCEKTQKEVSSPKKNREKSQER